MSDTGIPDGLRAALTSVARVPRLLVASDYDGCVSPIVSRPEDAVPNPASVAALVAAAELPDTAVAVVSGRERAVLAGLSGLVAPVTLVGSHGSEFESGFAVEVTDSARALLTQLIDELDSIAADFPGTTVEVKPASTVLHVRNASPADGDTALERVRTGPASKPGVHITEGKSVIELAVIETSKGHALDTLRERLDCDAVIYLGDDVTDEKAFAHLHPETGDVGIKVGAGTSAAQFRIEDTDDVASVLEFVVAERAASRA
ncbi:trehalose-phosphatase [Gordonia sp. zg691]|uniref:Trehalose 6-phosphate phosphatase n=1 Tax=Gordonia jinghuaiqii TaxID=2758710 RepID=A0A7D7LXI9_9ACTN|nr:trehalose-phosphatase [Gordonia jinghuaiqii]MBD0861661.1 trehalose-phosphatase [Gordonia jinghuaiqii]MCR5977554.1 trehalose-phosphatase [Gordonia jinghuaiqii]QMT02238.1 trehalose-phosphatase [Gordonia jinghuaiqii]